MPYSHRWLNLLLRLRPVHRPSSKKKKVQGSAAGRITLASSASSISVSSISSAGSLTTNTDSDTISTTTIPGTPGEDDGVLVLWGKPSIEAFGEGDDTQERQSAITKNDKSAVYRDRTVAKVCHHYSVLELRSTKICLLSGVCQDHTGSCDGPGTSWISCFCRSSKKR